MTIVVNISSGSIYMVVYCQVIKIIFVGICNIFMHCFFIYYI